MPLDSANIYYCGKLGAGIPIVADALDYLENIESRNDYFHPGRPTGKIIIDGKLRKGLWEINPAGAYRGFSFKISSERSNIDNQDLSFYTGDTLWLEDKIGSLSSEIFIPGSSVVVKYNKTRRRPGFALEIEYYPITIDSSALYCSDTRYYTIDSEDISDGSLKLNYSNNSACKWQISAPEGKHIELKFSEFDTQPNTDFVYIFDGESTIPANLIARFSGSNIPPLLTSRTNIVLVWFVSDSGITAQGWNLKYRFVDY